MKMNFLREKLSVPVSEFSKYRGELMGIATIMILVVHAFQCNVSFPGSLNNILRKTYIGVDIFLFVSGLGIWYSLEKNSSFLSFYKRRALKIFPVYLPIFLLFSLWKFWGGNLIDYISYVTTLDYWTKGIGVWYIALLIPLYLVTPFFYKLYKNRFPLLTTFIIILVIIGICELLKINSDIPLCYNIAFALKRTPSYFIGILFGRWAAEKKKFCLPIVLTISIIIMLVFNNLISFEYDKFGTMLSVICVLIFLFQIISIKIVNNVLKWFGMISLESYLFNDILIEIAKYYGFISDNIGNNEDFFDYTLIVLFGILFAYLHHVIIID